MDKAALRERVDDIVGDLGELAADVWTFAEPALTETRSAAALADRLEGAGFRVTRGVGELPTAFVARAGDADGPSIGLLGEYDALPGLSQAVATERQPDPDRDAGHGCGHNLHGVGALGGALVVAEAIEEGALDGEIVYCGTPAEETLVGKAYMARAGAFDDLDAALAWHPADLSTVRLGTANALRSVEYTFSGAAAHAATQPESGRSALDAVQLMNTGIEYLREHMPDDARLHYVITDGGAAPNVVPARAAVKYFIRAPTMDGVDRLAGRVGDVAEGAALMTGTAVEPSLITATHAYRPSATVGTTVWENLAAAGPVPFAEEDRAFAQELQGTISAGDRDGRLARYPPGIRDEIADTALHSEAHAPFDQEDHSAGTADLGEVCRVTPTVQFRVAAWPVGTPPHTWQAVAASGDLGMAALPVAAKTFAGTAWDLLAEPGLLVDAASEHEAMMGPDPYEPAVPGDTDPPTPS